MKISVLMKDYMKDIDDTERGLRRRLLPESFSNMRQDLPIAPTSNEWEVVDSPERLRRLYKFQNTHQRALFVEELLSAEEGHGHHAKITITGMEVLVEVWTHDLERVTELDQDYARDCDTLYKDVSLIGFNGDYR